MPSLTLIFCQYRQIFCHRKTKDNISNIADTYLPQSANVSSKTIHPDHEKKHWQTTHLESGMYELSIKYD
jgi:hypothetical protein